MSADLQRDLRALGDELAWPATPDLAGSLDLPARPVRTARRRWLLAAAAALAVLVPAGAAVGDDVLRWLGLASVEVEQRPRVPPGVVADLGERVSLKQAAGRAGFTPVVPDALGDPLEARYDGRVVTLVYPGVLLAQIPGALDDKVLRKISPEVERLPEGLWFDGDHSYLYLRPDGDVVSDQPRRAGPTLVTQRGDLVLRLEGPDLTRAEARKILR